MLGEQFYLVATSKRLLSVTVGSFSIGVSSGTVVWIGLVLTSHSGLVFDYLHFWVF